MNNVIIGIIIIAFLGVCLVVTCYLAYKGSKVSAEECKDFKKQIEVGKIMFIRYNYESPFIPTLEETFKVLDIKNEWVSLIRIKSKDNHEPYYEKVDEGIVNLPLDEACSIFHLQSIEE